MEILNTRPRLSISQRIFPPLHLILGIGLAASTLFALRDSLVNMEIKTAVLSQESEPVTSTSAGTLNKLYVQEGVKVEVGQPLFQVNNNESLDQEITHLNALSRNKIQQIDDLTQKIQLSRLELSSSQLEVNKAQSLREEELRKQGSYKLIATNQLESAKAKVSSLTIQRESAKNQVERLNLLLKEGAVTRQAVDVANSRFAEVDGSFNAAKEQLKIAELSIRDGNFYNGDRLISDLPRLSVEIKDLSAKVNLASQKVRTLEQAIQNNKRDLEALKQQRQHLDAVPSSVYKAPFSGHVLKITKSPGNTVNRDEVVVVLQRESQPTVDAYLTQDQASQLVKGDRVRVIVPSLNKEYQAQILTIDWEGGFTEKVTGKYRLQGSKDQPVHVKLVLLDTGAESSQLNSGLPVVVISPRKFDVSFRALTRQN